MRTERLRVQNENDFKSMLREAQHKKLIEVSDKKCLYNQIKRMVECGMKANEHLFIEESPKYEHLFLTLVLHSKLLLIILCTKARIKTRRGTRKTENCPRRFRRKGKRN